MRKKRSNQQTKKKTPEVQLPKTNFVKKLKEDELISFQNFFPLDQRGKYLETENIEQQKLLLHK